MKSLIHAFACLLMANSFCVAQEAQTTDNTNDKLAGFQWLQQFEGTWATDYNGTMKSKAVGKRWIVNELNFQTGLSAVQSIGYDTKEKKFIGSWIDENTNYKWDYTGFLDSTGRMLILEAEGPDMNDPKTSRQYRDTYEFKSENEIAVVSKMLNDEGEWKTFGTSTMKKKAEPEAPSTITPFLMFDSEAEAAIEFYKSVFPGMQVDSMTKYKAGENGKDGTVKLATVVIAGQRIKCTDSPVKPGFDFTPSFSFYVECENEKQLKERFDKLSDSGKIMMPLGNYGFSKQFGWVSDKFDVSWQLNLK